MQLWQKKIAKVYFLHNPEGNHPPKNTSVSEIQSHCDHDLYPFKHCNTVYCQIRSWGMATDLTLNYANFLP